jgi:hypothetical protein
MDYSDTGVTAIDKTDDVVYGGTTLSNVLLWRAAVEET